MFAVDLILLSTTIFDGITLKMLINTILISLLILLLLFSLYTKNNTITAESIMDYYINPPIYISKIYIYPIKSCAGIELTSSEYNTNGFLFDRQWVLIDTATNTANIANNDNNDSNNTAVNTAVNTFISQRTVPQMALIQPELDLKRGVLILKQLKINNNSGNSNNDSIVEPIEVPIKPDNSNSIAGTVSVWDDSITARIYTNSAINYWLSEVLQLSTIQLATILPNNLHKRPLNSNYDYSTNIDKPIQPRFADAFPFLLTNKASLIDLNKQIQITAASNNSNNKPAVPGRIVPMIAFRPNLVLSGRGLTAYAEDQIKLIQINNKSNTLSTTNQFLFTKPCTRCILPNVNPATGLRDSRGEPLVTLRRCRALDPPPSDPTEDIPVYFGQNLIQLSLSGSIAVGDSVSILDYKTEFHQMRKTPKI